MTDEERRSKKAAEMRIYRADPIHAEAHRAEVKKYNAEHHAEFLARHHAYYAAHREDCIIKGKEYGKDHRVERYDKTHEYNVNHREHRNETTKLWLASHPAAAQLIDKRHTYKRRMLQCVPLNRPFAGCNGHHIDKERVVFIPATLHASVRHNVWTGKNMEKINALAYEWLAKESMPC